jgi:hypothetical protein
MKWRALLVMALSLTLVGCSKPGLPHGAETSQRLEQLFPTLEALQLRVYFIDHECEYMAYRRGAFSSNVGDEWCRVFDFDGRHPGGNDALAPGPFDNDALQDLALYKGELAQLGIAVDSLNAVFDLVTGNISGPSRFSVAGTCGTLEYSPAWRAEDVPENFAGDSEVFRVDDQWFLVDYCPPHRQPGA